MAPGAEGEEVAMAKNPINNLDPVDVAMALDVALESGLLAPKAPDPANTPAQCIYLRHTTARILAVLTQHLPHVRVRFRTPGGSGKNAPVRPVFDLGSLLAVFRLLHLPEELYQPHPGKAKGWLRDFASIDKKYWKVLD